MAEVAPAPPAAAAPLPAKKKRISKTNSKTSPSLRDLILKAVGESKERSGLSLVGLKKSLTAAGYDVEKNKRRVRNTVKNLVEKGKLVHTKGSGASGSFKLSTKAASSKTKSPAKRTAPQSKKPAAKKVKKTTAAAKKTTAAAKKTTAAAGTKPAAKKPKKPAAAKTTKTSKSPKKTKTKSPKKTAAKRAAPKKPAAKKIKPAVKKAANKKK